MTNKLFKRFSLAIIVLMMVMALAACGDTATPAATSAAATTAATTSAAATTTTAAAATTTSAATTTAASATTTAAAATTAASTGNASSDTNGVTGLKGTLTVWEAYGSGGTGEPKAFADAVAQAKKDFPDLNLTVVDVPFDQLFTKFETEAAAGGGPDMFIAPNDSLGKEVRAGLFMDLTSKLNGKLGNDSKLSVDGMTVNGKLYAVPESLKAVAMVYNKSQISTPPATMDDLLNGVKSGKIKFGGAEDGYYDWGFWNAFGGQLFDSTGKCVADQGTGFTDAFTYLKNLKAAGATFYTDGNKKDEDFQNGTINVTIEGPWKEADFKKALGDNYGIAPIPAGPKGPGQPMTGVDGWYINQNTQSADLAVNFGLYMTSPKIEQLFVDEAGHIPANQTVKITDPLTQAYAQAVAAGYPRPQIAELDNYWSNMGDALSKLIDKSGDPATMVKTACQAINTANKKS